MASFSDTYRSVAWFSTLVLASHALTSEASATYQVKPVTDGQALEYGLDASYYKKCTLVQEILIATSEQVSDHAHREAAYQFDMIMRSIDTEVADVLGGAFRNHHGNWHADSTRGILVEAMKNHPILVGVEDIWGPSDVYRTFPESESLPPDCAPLVFGQPLLGRQPTDEANPKKEPLPVAWTKSWTGSTGKTARVFHVTMGSARDYQSEGLRRLTINAAYWCLGMEDRIRADCSVEYVGEYEPRESGFNYEKLKVFPKSPEAYR